MPEGFVWVMAVGVIGVGFVVWGAVIAVSTVSRERTRREIMAYVAEGAITPADAARLIEISEQADLRKKILSDASWSGGESYHKALDRVLGQPAEPKPEQA